MILTEIAANYAQFREEQAEVLAIVQCDRERAVQIARQTGLPFPLLVDEDGRIHRSAGAVDRSGHPAVAIYITDAFGEVFACIDCRRTNNAEYAGDCEVVKLHQYAVP